LALSPPPRLSKVEGFRSGLSAREQIRTYLLGAGAATAKAIGDATGLPGWYNDVERSGCASSDPSSLISIAAN